MLNHQKVRVSTSKTATMTLGRHWMGSFTNPSSNSESGAAEELLEQNGRGLMPESFSGVAINLMIFILYMGVTVVFVVIFTSIRIKSAVQ